MRPNRTASGRNPKDRDLRLGAVRLSTRSRKGCGQNEGWMLDYERLSIDCATVLIAEGIHLIRLDTDQPKSDKS